MNDCTVIEELWVLLNPHCQVHGCQVDLAGSVTIWILYSRSKQMQPLEMCIGNPPRTVIRSLKNALKEAARAKRLSLATGSSVIGEETGKQRVGEIGGRDK